MPDYLHVDRVVISYAPIRVLWRAGVEFRAGSGIQLNVTEAAGRGVVLEIAASGGSSPDPKVRTITGDDSVNSTDEIVFIDTTDGPVSLVLPAASARPGRQLAAIRVSPGDHAATIMASGDDKIVGAATMVLRLQGEGQRLVSDGGTGWWGF